ncbi:MAG: iron-sulfur cluster insertion protein ErpA [bacterium]
MRAFTREPRVCDDASLVFGSQTQKDDAMLTLTETAATKIRELIAKRPHPTDGLRVGVRGGGCSGFTYFLEFAEEPGENDRSIECSGVNLFVDRKSFLYLMGTEIDFVDGLAGAGFKFNNPNARRTCGCGESFSV